MGLAASQARLLMLTGRKDDVESGLMSLANQKLSLARESASLSKDYSNSLNATKLMWANGSSKDLDLTYGVLMKYNQDNQSGQYMLADNYGRAILNDTYANIFGADAKSGGNTGTITKSQFLQKMMGFDSKTADKYITAFVPKSTAAIIAQSTATDIVYKDSDVFHELANDTFHRPQWGDDKHFASDPNNGVEVDVNTSSSDATNRENLRELVQSVSGSTADALSAVLTNVPTGDRNFEKAVTLAEKETQTFYSSQWDRRNESGMVVHLDFWNAAPNQTGTNDVVVGIDTAYVDTTQMVKTFLNFFDQAYGITNNGVNDDSNSQNDGVRWTSSTRPNGGTDGSKVVKIVDVLPDEEEANYYINMYDYISQNGWSRSSGIDKDNGAYLQNQVLNGSAHLCQYVGDPNPNDDIPQSLWDTVSTNDEEMLISKEADEAKITESKAKYDAQKGELDYKESQIDLQMTNLDTERAALDTEVDSVKTILNKNIERSFKMFQNA